MQVITESQYQARDQQIIEALPAAPTKEVADKFGLSVALKKLTEE